MDKPKISVVIIAKNEEKNIARCLASVRWADEVIVVDGFSTDKTASIAESFGAKVIRHRFTGSFADERNFGMDAAGNDWTLHIDADDVVTEEFAAGAAEALSKGEGAAVYKFLRKNFFLGHRMDYGGFHHYIPNLVNKRFVKYEGAVHEVPACKGNVGTIEGAIEHYPFDSISQFIERQNRYTDIAAKQVFQTEGRLNEAAIKKNMIGRSFKIFWKSYIKKQGYRDGIYGLVFAILFSLINFMKWAKYWELVNLKSNQVRHTLT